MAKSKTHPGPHKYQRVKWGQKETIVWRCTLPNCAHYTHPEFIVGKTTLCHGCGSPCKMDRMRAYRVKPKCDNCVRTTKTELVDSMEKLLEDL